MKLPTFKSEIRFGLPMLPLYVDAAAVAFIQKPPIVCGRTFYGQSMMWMTEGGSKGEVILPRNEYEEMWGWINKNRDEVYKQYQSWRKKKDIFFRDVNAFIQNKKKQPHLFTKLFEEYVSLYAIASMTEGGLVGSELVVKELINSKVSKDDAVFLVGPKKQSFLAQNQLELLKIASVFPKDKVFLGNLKKEYPTLWSKIEQHAQEYHWILNNYKDVQILSPEFFFNQIKEICVQRKANRILNEVKKLESMENDHQNKLLELNKRYELPTELKELAATSAFLGEWTDERKALNLLGNTLLLCFVSYAERELEISRKDLEYFTFSEINTFLAGKKFDFTKLKQREEAVLMIHAANKTEIISGAEANSAIAKVSLKITDVDVIEGTVASQGKVRGKVRIVLDPFKAKLEQGEILVTSMTRPDFVILMEKAAAFVTDEGGITSHAGILAREMGKPCIVGTNIATKVLKNGDWVEVDAYHGRIRKIKN